MNLKKENKISEEEILELDKNILETVRNPLINSLATGVSTAYLLLLIINEKKLKLEDFKNIIKNIDDKIIKDFIKNYVSNNNIEEIFSLHLKYEEELLKEYILKIKDKNFHNYETSDSLIELSIKLLKFKNTDTVADLGMGNGKFLVSAFEENPNLEYFGIDINSEMYKIAYIRSKILGENIIVKYGDMFNESIKNKYNKIFSNYPFSMNLRSQIQGTKYSDILEKKELKINNATSSDWIFNLLMTDLISEKGKAIGIMSIGNAVKSTDKELRKYFIDNGLIECIIELPEKIFEYTSIKTMMVIFSKGNSTIRMIDASQFYKKGRRVNTMEKDEINTIIDATEKNHQSDYSIKVNYETIKGNNYTLLPTIYLNDKPLENGIVFGDIVKSITRGATITASQLDSMVSDIDTGYQYLMLSDIKDGLINKNLPFIEKIDKKDEKYCLKDNNLIFSKIGSPLKIAIADNIGKKNILANGNLFIVKVDETKADPYFIKAFFESEQGVDSIKKITAGSTIPNISLTNLQGIIIPNISLKEQKKIGEKYKAKMQEISDLKSKLAKAMEELKKIC